MAHGAIRILMSLSLSYSLPWPEAFAKLDPFSVAVSATAIYARYGEILTVTGAGSAAWSGAASAVIAFTNVGWSDTIANGAISPPLADDGFGQRLALDGDGLVVGIVIIGGGVGEMAHVVGACASLNSACDRGALADNCAVIRVGLQCT
jgi:hypothetical protein